MDKFFLNTLNDYKIICEKICSHKDYLDEYTIDFLNKKFNYREILIILKDTIILLEDLKQKSEIYYTLISDEFYTNVYIEENGNNDKKLNLKKHYNDLCYKNSSDNISFGSYTHYWKDVFIYEGEKTEMLNNNFLFKDIKKPDGIIYKKFYSLLYILYWLKLKIDLLISNNNELLEIVKNNILKNKEFKDKFNLVTTENLNAYTDFMSNIKKNEDIIIDLNNSKEKASIILSEIDSKTKDIANLINDVTTTKQQAEELLKINQELSEKLSSKALSGTFEEAANSYSWGKRGKLFLISIISIGLFYFSYDMLKNFDIEKMLLLEKSPLVLLIYSTPRLFIFIISAWVLKFLISNYNNDSKIALDFKHRQAIADVTPHFKKELDSKEKQEDLVVNAFNVFLSKPQFEANNKEKGNTILLENLSTILNDSEIKNTFVKFRDLFIDKINTKKTENQENKP